MATDAKVLDVTLTGTMRMTRAALRHMYDNLAGVPGAKAPPVGRSAVKVRVGG